jgi:hypothetical protein
MTWARSSLPTGGSVYTSGGWRIEADVHHSTHTGMVFGQFVNEAGRVGRTVGWTIIKPDGRIAWKCPKLADAKAYVERRSS